MNVSRLFPMLAVSGVLMLGGLGCTKKDTPVVEGEKTSDLPAESAQLPKTGTTDGTTADTKDFTVDLVPEGGDLSGSVPVKVDGDTASTDTTEDTAAGTDTTKTEETTKKDDLSDLIAVPAKSSTTGKDAVSTTESEIRTLAEKWVEIYGTFTNKDKEPFRNLKDLSPYATEKMQTAMDTLMAASKHDPNAAFFGRTTTALSSVVLSQKGSAATLLVTAKREDIIGTKPAPKSVYFMIRVELMRKGDEWKLDSVTFFQPEASF